jgi:peptidoglycan hydrolase CwlO-like protein
MFKRGIVKYFVALVLLASSAQFAKADTLQEINKKIEQNRAAAKNTQSQIMSYDSALKRIESSMQTTQEKISETSNQIGSTQEKVNELSRQIDQKNKELVELKKKLNSAVVEIYRFSSRSSFDLLLSDENLGTNSNQSNYVSAVEIQVKSMHTKVETIKQDLEKNRTDTENEKNRLEQLKQSQAGYLSSLDYQTGVNKNLKSNAQGALQDYQSTISKLEAQKSAMEAAQRGIRRGGSMIGGSDLVTGSAGWYYSQDNPDWASMNIGDSDSTIGRYGCALTSLAMVLTKYGVNKTPADIASNPAYFNNDLIVWPSIGGHSLHGGGGWSDVDSSIADGRPVITKLNAYGGTHFVVIYSKSSDGKYLILDPISGSRTYGKSLVAQFYFYY